MQIQLFSVMLLYFVTKHSTQKNTPKNTWLCSKYNQLSDWWRLISVAGFPSNSLSLVTVFPSTTELAICFVFMMFQYRMIHGLKGSSVASWARWEIEVTSGLNKYTCAFTAWCIMHTIKWKIWDRTKRRPLTTEGNI